MFGVNKKTTRVATRKRKRDRSGQDHLERDDLISPVPLRPRARENPNRTAGRAWS